MGDWSHDFGPDNRWIEVDDTPTPDAAINGSAIMYFARIAHDHVAGERTYRADAAPGTMSTGVDHADAELVMRVAREVVAGNETNGGDASDDGRELLRVVDVCGYGGQTSSRREPQYQDVR